MSLVRRLWKIFRNEVDVECENDEEGDDEDDDEVNDTDDDCKWEGGGTSVEQASVDCPLGVKPNRSNGFKTSCFVVNVIECWSNGFWDKTD